MLNSIKTYIIGIGAFIGLAMVGVIQYLSRKNKQLEHDNSVFNKVEEIRSEQVIEKARIIESEDRRIDDKIEEINKSDKDRTDMFNSL